MSQIEGVPLWGTIRIMGYNDGGAYGWWSGIVVVNPMVCLACLDLPTSRRSSSVVVDDGAEC